MSRETAMRVGTVHACVKAIAETSATLPHEIIQIGEDGSRRKATELVEYDLIKHQANPINAAVSFWETVDTCSNLVGNGYVWIERIKRGPGAGRPICMWPLHPDQVEVKRAGRDIYYVVHPMGAGDVVREKMVLFPGDMMHFPVMPLNGLTGASQVRYANNIFKAMRDQQNFQGSFFSQGVTPRAVLTTEESMDEDDLKANQELLNMATSGANAHRAIILPFGLQWKPISMKAEDVAAMDNYGITERQICGLYRMPPPIIQNHERSTYSNTEQLDQAFAKHCIRPFLTRRENIMNMQLLTAEQRAQGYTVKVNMSALLRGADKDRYEAHQVGITSGFLTRNEARMLEDMSPIDGLDEILVPLNHAPNGENQDKNAAKRSNVIEITTHKAVENELKEELESVKSHANRAFQAIISDTFKRMITRERSEILKNARKSTAKEFDAWFDKWITKHQDYYHVNFAPLARAISVGDASAVDLVVRQEAFTHRQRLKSTMRGLLEESGGDWPKFIASIEAYYDNLDTNSAADASVAGWLQKGA